MELTRGSSTLQSSSSSNSTVNLVSKGDHLFAIFTFTMVGLLSLYPWNAVLNVIFDVTTFVFGNALYSDTIVIVYETLNIVVVVYFVLRGGVYPELLTGIAFAFGLLMLSVPLIPQIWPNVTGVVLLHLATLPLGFCVGCVLATGFSLAAVMPFNYSGYVAFGMGISGVASFFVWILFDRVVFIRSITRITPLDKQRLLYSSWGLFSVGTLIAFGTGFMLIAISRKYWFQLRVNNYWANAAAENTENHINSAFQTGEEIPLSQMPPRPLKLILKDSFAQLFNSGYSLLITLLLFPQIGPFGWFGNNLRDVSIGIFQIGDFVGRYLPNGGKWLRMPKKYLIVATLFRTVFIPLFALSMILRNSIFNTFWLQALLMTTFSLSNGWIVTQALIYAPDCVVRLKEKGRIGTYSTLSMQLCVLLGLYLSKLLKLLLTLLVPAAIVT